MKKPILLDMFGVGEDDAAIDEYVSSLTDEDAQDEASRYVEVSKSALALVQKNLKSFQDNDRDEVYRAEVIKYAGVASLCRVAVEMITKDEGMLAAVNENESLAREMRRETYPPL